MAALKIIKKIEGDYNMIYYFLGSKMQNCPKRLNCKTILKVFSKFKLYQGLICKNLLLLIELGSNQVWIKIG